MTSKLHFHVRIWHHPSCKSMPVRVSCVWPLSSLFSTSCLSEVVMTTFMPRKLMIHLERLSFSRRAVCWPGQVFLHQSTYLLPIKTTEHIVHPVRWRIPLNYCFWCGRRINAGFKWLIITESLRDCNTTHQLHQLKKSPDYKWHCSQTWFVCNIYMKSY